MNENSNKKVTTIVPLETWTELKVMSLRKRITLEVLLRDILEKYVSKKIKSNPEESI